MEKDPTITVIGGGSGPLSIEDELLNNTPHVLGITGVHDSGGHSGEIRSVLGVRPGGDATHRMAIRIRNPKVRELFTHRWQLDKSHPMNGHRPSNEMLAAAECLAGCHSGGIKIIEEAFSTHYLGRVIPVSDDDVHLRAIFANGRHLDGEGKIDRRKKSTPKIVDIDFIPHPPTPNHEAIDAVLQTDAIVISPGSWITSIKPILRTLREAIRQSSAPVIYFCNAFTNYSETHGYTASTFTRELYKELGAKPTYTFINVPAHDVPEAYAKLEKSYIVKVDLENCQPYTQCTHTLPLTEACAINGKLVVRHNGSLAAALIIGIIQGRTVEEILEELKFIPCTPH